MTSTTRNATSSDIAVYNTFVQNAANASPTVNSWGLTWTAIASTSSVNAITNTNTPTGTLNVPIYLVNGTKVADNYADLWDGSLDAPINRTEQDVVFFSLVWTGTHESGQQSGAPLGALGEVTYGDSNRPAGGHWVRSLTDVEPEFLPLYGMSHVITAQGAAVPEPSSALLLGLVGIGWVAKRRGRRVLSCKQNM